MKHQIEVEPSDNLAISNYLKSNLLKSIYAHIDGVGKEIKIEGDLYDCRFLLNDEPIKHYNIKRLIFNFEYNPAIRFGDIWTFDPQIKLDELPNTLNVGNYVAKVLDLASMKIRVGILRIHSDSIGDFGGAFLFDYRNHVCIEVTNILD